MRTARSFVAAVLLTACGPGAAHEVRDPMTTTTPAWTVLFSDGSGNATRLARTDGEGLASFEYIPVAPAASSSGFYSGGEPVHGEVSPATEATLWALVHGCRDARGEHAEVREKGTGAVHASSAGGVVSYLLARGGCLDRWVVFVDELRRSGTPGPAPVAYVGLAVNAKAGAVLVTDGGEILVGLAAWPGDALGRRVRVHGRWAQRADLPAFVETPGEPVAAGMPVPVGGDGDRARTRQVLTEPRWEILE